MRKLYNDELLNYTLDQINNISKLDNKKIFITGATGFIGSVLVHSIIYFVKNKKMNIEIYCGSRSREKFDYSFPKEPFIHFVEYNIYDTVNHDEDYDYIIHAASNAQPNKYVNEPVETMLGNIIGMNNLLDAYKNKKTRVLYISSSEVYGQLKSSNTISESKYGELDILNPRSSYPSSKRATETLCISYYSQFKTDVVIARPGHVYGPIMDVNDSRAYAEFIKKGIKNENIVLKSSGLQMRSYIHVYDVASALITILLQGKIGNAYNVSNKNSLHTIKDLASEISKISNVKLVSKSPTNEEIKQFNFMKNASLNSEKLEKLNWTPKIDFSEGIIHSIEKTKTEGNL